MRFVLFYHSLVSDWNYGTAHFLRGIAQELMTRGHVVDVYEPRDSVSRQGLQTEKGSEALDAYKVPYPQLTSTPYDSHAFARQGSVALGKVLKDADVVIVHEYNDPELIRAIGEHHSRHHSYELLFHDTHHRSVTYGRARSACDLEHYDGVLAFGDVVRDLYLTRGWSKRAWTWHEAADTRIFKPLRTVSSQHAYSKQYSSFVAPVNGSGKSTGRNSNDVVFLGNWCDEERTAELREFLFEPVKSLRLRATVFGARYPQPIVEEMNRAGINHAGYLPNFRVPQVYGRFKFTVHVPRRPYSRLLPGIPTIRVFEALACGIPLISAPWSDVEHLFLPGADFLMARTGAEMKAHMHFLMTQPKARKQLASHGRQTIMKRHTIAHRVDELLDICADLRASRNPFFTLVAPTPVTTLRAARALERLSAGKMAGKVNGADIAINHIDERELVRVPVAKR